MNPLMMTNMPLQGMQQPQGMNGYGQQQITPEQYGAALQAYDVLQRRDDAMKVAQRAGGAQLFGAALGNLLASKFGKHKGQDLASVSDQIEQYHAQMQAQQQAKADAAKRAEAERLYQRNKADDLEKFNREQAGRMDIAKYKVDNQKAMQITNNMPGGEKATEFQKKLAGKNADRYDTWRTEAMGANETLSNISNLRELSKLQETGKFNEYTAKVGELFGTDAASNKQAFDSIQKKMMLDAASSLSGTMSDSEWGIMEQIMPAFGKDPRANAQIMDILGNAANRSIENFKAADDYAMKHGHMQGFQPLFNFREKRSGLGASGEQQTQKQGGQIMVDADGNRAMVYPDGSFEEL